MMEDKIPKVYDIREEEQYLHRYAQHNEDCEKIWGLTDRTEERGEFQRDRERIVNAKSFRRMVDKAQIFTSSKGDHYRTRMTHTMEVAQIARSIANSLQLNIDLTEAIALGHDLGHTPFGHQGERTLQDILTGKIDVGLPKVEGNNVYGGFKHNFQSVRMLNVLEEKYILHEGLDVSYQVLEGVLKHTGFKRKDCNNCRKRTGNEKCFEKKCCDLKVFLGTGDESNLYIEYPFSTTLEGQVVAIADEIAQRSHDVDDAMTAGYLEYVELSDFLQKNGLEAIGKVINSSYSKIMKRGRDYVSERQIICARVISDIVNYLVNDVVKQSRKNICAFQEDELYLKKHRFSACLICFSKEGERTCKLLESMVSRKVLNNPEVAKFDYNASRVIKRLFEIYYHNPRLLHINTLQKLSIEIKKKTGKSIDFVDEDTQKIEKEFKRLTEDAVWSLESNRRENWEEHRILVRVIVDYIAGMTDSYARNEYKSFAEMEFTELSGTHGVSGRML